MFFVWKDKALYFVNKTVRYQQNGCFVTWFQVFVIVILQSKKRWFLTLLVNWKPDAESGVIMYKFQITVWMLHEKTIQFSDKHSISACSFNHANMKAVWPKSSGNTELIFFFSFFFLKTQCCCFKCHIWKCVSLFCYFSQCFLILWHPELVTLVIFLEKRLVWAFIFSVVTLISES